MKPISQTTDGFFYTQKMQLQEIYSIFLKSSGVVTDTRKTTPNCLFFCLKGGNFDGNDFAQEALDKGALAVVIDKPTVSVQDRTYLVEDALKSLQELAHHHRQQFNIPVIGITGSNGKTTTKELIAAVLQTQFNVLFTQGNLNNHIGVPLTLLEIKPAHEIAIIEMGANKPGDIQELVEIAVPTHGIITNIGHAHLEGFKNLAGVIQTKTELYRYIDEHKGELFVHASDKILANHIPTEIATQTYGENGEVTGELVDLNPFVVMKWSYNGIQSNHIQTQLVGKYNFINFLAAIRVGLHFGISAENCSKAIETYTPTNNRSQVTKTDRNTLIVDCYNANPTSMESAIESFALINEHVKIFVLGDMLEMGESSSTVHQEIVELTIKHRLSGFFVGEEFFKWKRIHPQAIFLKSTQPLIEHFEQNPPKEVLILLKGSRGIQLEKLIALL